MLIPSDIRVANLRSGHLSVSESAPQISFKVLGSKPKWSLDAAEFSLTIGETTELAKVTSPNQIAIPWMFGKLDSFTRFELRVRIFDGEVWSDWSEAALFETGPLTPEDWTAQMVGSSWSEQPASIRKPPVFRKEFVIEESVKTARLYFTAHGVAEAYINGVKVGDDLLTPGFTNYDATLNFYAYDVTDLLRLGVNCISVLTGDGWYRGNIGFDGGAWDNFGDQIGVFAELRTEDITGDIKSVVTDSSWTAGFGPIQSSGLYEGEFYDAREENEGWQSSGFNAIGFTPVSIQNFNKETLRRPQAAPVRVIDELKPVSIIKSEESYLIDFGQNFSGTVQITIPEMSAGESISIRHAEVLEEGKLCRRPLRRATAEDTYISNGNRATWSPRFTIHGFRYAEVIGWPGELTSQDITARVIHTDMESTGHFECSNELINRFHENVVWSTKSNFVSIPTDCPQRDERLGWTGDIQVFAPTALLLFDAAPTIRDWMEDVRYEQKQAGGYIPVFVPTLPKHEHFWYDQMRVSGWSDVVTLTPRSLYDATGELSDLSENLDAGETWVDKMCQEADKDLNWSRDLQLGDWLDPAAPPEDPTKAITDPFLVANAYFAASARAVAESAIDLGKPHEYLSQRADAVRKAFQDTYCNADGTMTSDTQTAYALALVFNLTPSEHRRIAGERLAELVRESEGHISTGFAGTPRVLPALTAAGHIAEAFSLLEQTSCPSFLYPITMGATTTWERWDSMLPNGRVNPGDMTSFNHYALGAAASWLYNTVAGLAPTSPGWQTIRFAPTLGGGLTSAKASHETPYGLAAIEWELADDLLHVKCTVPNGSKAEFIFAGEHKTLQPGRHEFSLRVAQTD
ncbi:alpha-L-rhamnosidase [Gleimia europaea]|uniref:alpha-L-rhamnosidase n=1 Tax=Gleimia europaea TaxID=66228 RepID=UPI0027887D85|nr:alpha-L-rhamnosidase [Gleimia europaea]MDP9833540.1 alpha-L-rhamnosidase [Gleimia europaea]